jgi:hypothetical protein
MPNWVEQLEFHRAIQGFDKMESVWTALANDHENDPGKQAYALKTANMYQEMQEDVQKKFHKVGGTWPRSGVSFAEHIKSERPDRKIDWEAIIAGEN